VENGPQASLYGGIDAESRRFEHGSSRTVEPRRNDDRRTIMRRKHGATATALAIAGLAIMLGSATPVRAADPPNAKCHSGDILTGTYNNVVVPKGNFCLLLGATVLHNVIANGATQLGIDNSKIGGNVEAHHVTDNGWLCGSTVGHNVDITDAGQSSAEPGSWFIGDAS
jgi:hypothetical protein